MFEVRLSKLAEKQLYKLPQNIQNRIIRTLERIKIRPHAHIKKLVSSPYFVLRVGDYRVILDIKNKELVILIIEIGHRKNIYKS